MSDALHLRECADGRVSDLCERQVQNAQVDDGNTCTTGDACDGAGACDPGGPLDCDDLDPCTADACDAIAGCTHDPIALCNSPVPASGGWARLLLGLVLGSAGALLLGQRRLARNRSHVRRDIG